MFEENRALQKATSGRGRWNPWDVSSEFRAREAARAGWFVAGWQAVWGLIGVALGGAVAVSAGPRSHLINADLILVGSLVYVGLFAGLGWVIRQWQPRWASIVLLLLMLLVVATELAAPNFGLVINLVLMGLTVLSIRGAFAYANLRRNPDANPVVAAQTFD